MSARQTPLVTIISPSFNQGRFITDCLDSVRSQTYPHIEHIVQDGGSTDETVAILAGSTDGVRWTSAPDGGQSDAINQAFAAGGGELVGWINSDDALFSVDAVETMVRMFQRHPAVDVFYGNAAIMSADGRLLREHVAPRRLPWGGFPRGFTPISQPATFFRRRALGADEPLLREDLHYKLDLELWLRLHQRGSIFQHLPRVIAADRDHADRKVRLLAESHASEWSMLEAQYGVTFTQPGLVGRSKLLARRARGLRTVWGWERDYAPAFSWHVDSRGKRVVRQVAQSHRRITAAGRGL